MRPSLNSSASKRLLTVEGFSALPNLSLAHFIPQLDNLGPFEPSPVLVVAVSGGRDSMALLHLVNQWTLSRDGRVIALTVNHGLRNGSEHDARWVALQCQARSIEHVTLPWLEAKPIKGLQAAARSFRYRAMSHFCKIRGYLHLLVAHHLNDNAETQTMRAKRNQEQQLGLSGMSAARSMGDVRLLRPLLPFSRSQITAYCKDHHIPWRDDPSNCNTAFERVSIRASGRASGRASAVNCAAASSTRVTMERRASQWLNAHSVPNRTGEIKISLPKEWASADHICLAIAWCLRWVRGGQGYLQSLDRVRNALDCRNVDRTLGGVLFSWSKSEPRCIVTMKREARNLPSNVAIGINQTIIWDDRLLLTAKVAGAIRPIGAISVKKLAALPGADMIAHWPQSSRQTWPMLTENGNILGIGHLGKGVLQVQFAPQNTLVPQEFLPWDR